MKTHRRKLLLLAPALLASVNFSLFTSALAQESRPVPAQTPARSDYLLRISTKDLTTISLKAERIPLSSIAGDISKKIKLPIILGPAAGKRQVTTDFKSLTLESAMQLLAPQVYIDYEINRSPGAPPQPVGIYLNDHDDPPPAINAVIRNSSQGLLIEGGGRVGDSRGGAKRAASADHL